MTKSLNVEALEAQARAIRRDCVRMAAYSRSSHVGSALSIADVVTLLYFHVMKVDPKDPQLDSRDRLVLSKAHGSSALYAALAERGFFDRKILDRYYIDGGALPGHLDRTAAPGIEFSAGSLGHGLPAAVGMALGLRDHPARPRVFCIVGDGECNEGSIWEAAMLGSHLKLDRLTVFIDYNKIQSFGNTNEVIDQSNLPARFRAFGWETLEANGHDFAEMALAVEAPSNGRPKAVVLDTVKGKGVSYMENKLEWHYRSPNPEQLQQALEELAAK